MILGLNYMIKQMFVKSSNRIRRMLIHVQTTNIYVGNSYINIFIHLFIIQDIHRDSFFKLNQFFVYTCNRNKCISTLFSTELPFIDCNERKSREYVKKCTIFSK